MKKRELIRALEKLKSSLEAIDENNHYWSKETLKDQICSLEYSCLDNAINYICGDYEAS